MTRHLHFDCFNGISGDMTLGALVDLGVDLDELRRRLARLPIGDFTLSAERVKRQGIVGTLVSVGVEEDPHGHAHLRHIVAKVEAAELGEVATRRAVAAYRLLAEAEAKVHGSTPEKIHFHEVGAKDAVADVAGAMVAVELLGAETFSCSPVATGWGTVKCAHGIMPVPAPATAELLAGLPTVATDIESELTTPTGAAILRVLVGESPGRPASFRPERVGYGAGTRRVEGHPNYLRATLGEADAPRATLPADEETVVRLETEIDDMSPEIAGHTIERLLAAGALDAHLQPVQMKKNRPGFRLTVLCREADADRAAELVLRETTTFGVRVSTARRLCLRRRTDVVRTEFGDVEVKVGLWGDETLKASPEFESCRRAATAAGVPVARVFEAARRAHAEGGLAPPAG